jgi:predicted nucleotidyltransferase
VDERHPIDPDCRTEIVRRLAAAEVEHEVRIVYACESGSRAWGFASTDSDYDVRFLYVRPRDWYLSFDVERRRDVIEYPIVDEIDCSGWDLRKALYLFTRTNGALLEWLHSPIVYREEGSAAGALRRLAADAMNSTALCYHYSHMARTNTRGALDRPEVRLKKYFYVLRPLLAIRWIEAGRGLPPVEFERLLEAMVPPELLAPVEALLARKRLEPEVGTGPQVPELHAFIDAELARHDERFSGQGRPLLDGAELRSALNEVFRAAVET